MRKLVFVILLNMILFTYASDRIVGVWDWVGDKGSDIREAKVQFCPDGNAFYKISNTNPIKAKWKLLGVDTLVVTSDSFIWDPRFIEFEPNEFQYSYDVEYSPQENGKLLCCSGYNEIYILKANEAILIPIGKKEKGFLKKTDMSDALFENYTPHKTPCLLNHYAEIEGRPISRHAALKNDNIIKATMDAFPQKEPNLKSHLLENLPNRIDSIEFKLIDYFHIYIYTKSDYLAVDRKGFDEVFDYLIENDSNKQALIHITTADSTLISQFCDLLDESVPFPSEAIITTPNNAYRQSRGGNNIYTERTQNIDPIEVRAKVILYHDDAVTNCYLSMRSIDYKAHRYALSKRMFDFFFLLYVKWEQLNY